MCIRDSRTTEQEFLMIRRPPRSTQSRSSAASDVYKRQVFFSKDDFLIYESVSGFSALQSNDIIVSIILQISIVLTGVYLLRKWWVLEKSDNKLS